MARMQHLEEKCVRLLREIDVNQASVPDMPSRCRPIPLSNAMASMQRKKFRFHRVRSSPNSRCFKKKATARRLIVADLELNKLILKVEP